MPQHPPTTEMLCFVTNSIHVIRERFRLQRIHGLTIHIQRQPRIWNARNGQRGIFAEEADRLAHVFGTRGAVETDDVDAHAFEDGERRVDVGAEQHATRRVQRDLSLDRQIWFESHRRLCECP